MPIQIIDNFDLNSPQPLDNRFVVGSQSFYTTKESIPFKYPGMRIWDLNQGSYGIPYVWTGTTFSSENTTSISGGGDSNYIPVLTGVSTLGNSIIYQDNNQLSINGNSFTTGYTLTVNGGISAVGSNGFKGDGSQITVLNAGNISSGFLSLSRLSNSSNPNWILTSGSGGNGNMVFVNSDNINVGSSNRLSATYSIFGQSFNGSQNVSGNIQIGSTTGKATITYDQSTSRIVTIPSLGGNRTFAFLEQNQTFSGSNIFKFIQTIDTDETIYGSSITYPLRVGYGKYLSLGASSVTGGLIQTFSNKDLRINLLGNNVVVGDYSLGPFRPKLGINSYPSIYDLHLGYDSAFKPTTNTWTTTSDVRLKENIIDADLDRCLYIVDNLPLKKYRWMDKYYSDDQVSDDRNKLGWIADEVQEFFPKGVKIIENFDFNNGETIENLKTLNTDQIYAVLYGAVKKLSQNNKDLINFIKESNDLSDLKNKISQSSQTTN